MAAKEAFGIIMHNVVAFATVSAVANFMILLGKICIMGVCLLIFNGFINGASWTENFAVIGIADVDMSDISSPIFPMVVCLLFAFAVASYFLNLYSMAIDTTLMCHF